jgi:hypothetical protein
MLMALQYAASDSKKQLQLFNEAVETKRGEVRIREQNGAKDDPRTVVAQQELKFLESPEGRDERNEFVMLATKAGVDPEEFRREFNRDLARARVQWVEDHDASRLTIERFIQRMFHSSGVTSSEIMNALWALGSVQLSRGDVNGAECLYNAAMKRALASGKASVQEVSMLQDYCAFLMDVRHDYRRASERLGYVDNLLLPALSIPTPELVARQKTLKAHLSRLDTAASRQSTVTAPE